MKGRIQIGDWKLDLDCDIEVFEGQLIPHSEYGAKFKREATQEEKDELIEEWGYEA
jgi:hypothetical protein